MPPPSALPGRRRGYDLSNEEDRNHFLADLRWTSAESLLKRALREREVRRLQQHTSLVAEGAGGGAGGGLDLSSLRLALKVVLTRVAADR